MLSDYSALGIFFLLTTLFPIGALVMAWMVRPKPKQTEEKLTTYECGVDT